jgi:Rap1a immunity proteins
MRLRSFNARVAVLMIGWATPAASFTGVELFDLCFRKGADGQLACTSYVRGFADGIAFEGLMVGGDAKYCPPQSLPGREIRLIVEKYLKDHPDQLGKEAGALVGLALHQAFPCKKLR